MDEIRRAYLSVETKPASGPNGENTECSIHIEGSTNDLLNAFQQLSANLIKTLIERYGKGIAMGLYSTAQVEALKQIGVDVNKEAEEGAEKLKRLKRLQALESIIGKTFEMPSKDGGEE